jgi:hypothetical protein
MVWMDEIVCSRGNTVNEVVADIRGDKIAIKCVLQGG